MKNSIIFAGSSAFSASVLSFLTSLDSISIEMVITLPPKKTGRGKKLQENPVQQEAQKKDLPTILVNSLKNQKIISHLSSINCDYLLVVAFGLIIPKWLLEHPKKLPLNIHASLLPRWRGASPIHQSLLHGDKETGICLMKMTQGLDEGPVLIQKNIPIEKNDIFTTLEAKLLKLSLGVLSSYFNCPNNYQLTPQEGQEIYAPKIEKKDGLITPKMTTEKAIATFKAFNLWPGLSFVDKKSGQIIKILSIDYSPLESNEHEGNIEVTSDCLLFHFAKNAIKVFKIQFPGKKPLMIKDCAHDKNHKIYQLSF